MKCQPKAWNTDFLPTERGGRTGEYWPNVTALGPYRNNWGPIISWTAPASDTFELSNIWAGAFSFKTIAHCAKLTTNLQLDHYWFNIKQKCGRICYTIWRKKRSNILVTISLTNQLQVFIVEVSCLRSQFEDMLCNSTFSSKYIYPWELSPIATAKIGASWKTPVSVNVGPPSKNGFRVRQLSDSDHIQHPADLKPQEGYQYWASKVSIFG